MRDPFIPKLSLGENPFRSGMDMSGVTGTGMVRTAATLSPAEGTSFKSVMSDAINSVNNTLSAPDHLMQQAMVGNNVDVHDIMIANAKAELTVNIAAQMTTKVIQAYDRILQIQI